MKGPCGLTVLFYLFRLSLYPQFETCTVTDIALPLGPSRAVLFLVTGSMEVLSIETATRGGILTKFIDFWGDIPRVRIRTVTLSKP